MDRSKQARMQELVERLNKAAKAYYQALIDSYKSFDTNSIKKLTVQVHFLEPIPYEKYQGMKTTEIAAMVKQRIEETIKEFEEM